MTLTVLRCIAELATDVDSDRAVCGSALFVETKLKVLDTAQAPALDGEEIERWVGYGSKRELIACAQCSALYRLEAGTLIGLDPEVGEVIVSAHYA